MQLFHRSTGRAVITQEPHHACMHAAVMSLAGLAQNRQCFCTLHGILGAAEEGGESEGGKSPGCRARPVLEQGVPQCACQRERRQNRQGQHSWQAFQDCDCPNLEACRACQLLQSSGKHQGFWLLQVWDVATQSCRHTLCHHKGKVQAVAWNPAEAPVLLSGAFDKVAALVSCSQCPLDTACHARPSLHHAAASSPVTPKNSIGSPFLVGTSEASQTRHLMYRRAHQHDPKQINNKAKEISKG